VIRHRWRSHIKSADDERALLALVNNYLDEWTATERAQLPNTAWPGRVDTAKSLSEWTFRLVELHREFQGDSSQALVHLQNLLLFFTHACVRMAQLARLKATTGTDIES
jgi:hypothetical protein